MTKKDFWYSIDGDTRYQLTSLSSVWRDRAVDAAEDYHSNHDGWEARWPLVIQLFETEEGPPVARFEIERESVPEFFASELSLTPAPEPHP